MSSPLQLVEEVEQEFDVNGRARLTVQIAARLRFNEKSVPVRH